ncbi:MAG: archaemetzincin family Zn-dependent metalloprotease [Syntrophorhabdaceae bacterium]
MKLQIIPVGVTDFEIIEMLKHGVEDFLAADVRLGGVLECPVYAYDSGRNQYSAEAILNDLAARGLDYHCGHVLGVVDCDLYIPDLTFVFGVALGKTALVSLTRLKGEFYGLAPDKDLLTKRLLTEAVHEIGHLYGMRHCFDPECVMFFSHNLNDTDRKGFDFCDKCGELLSRLSKPRLDIDEDDPRLKPSLNIML